jgi:Starch-binding associating with outer membrane
MKIKQLIILVAVMVLSSCQKFEDVAKNPNLPTSSPASLIMSGVLNSMHESAWNKMMRHNQFYAINYNYYGNNEYDWTTTDVRWDQLKNVIKMEEEAKTSTGKDANPYSAMGKFFRAYFFNYMTTRVGDLPMTEALKGTGNTTPKFNTQKEIYIQILKWLDESNNDFAALILAGDRSMVGDIYLQNDLRAWQKVVNSYKLRVLISLSKKESDTDLNIKKQFSDIVSNPTKYPLMTSMANNAQYNYNATFNKYPINPDNFGFDATRQNMAATHIGLLTSLKDPRVFVVAEPAEAKIKAGMKATDFEAYVGARNDESLDDMSTKILKGDYSLINRKRYYANYTAESTILIGYPEQCFNIAEAINRGWISGDAAQNYETGLKASLSFFGISDVAQSAYLAQESVKLKTGNEGLSQILTQKYLAFFQNSGYEAFFNYRRTGVPAFVEGGAGTGNSGRIAKRWLYPNSERLYNKSNYEAAITSQFGGKDNVNDAIWTLK